MGPECTSIFSHFGTFFKNAAALCYSPLVSIRVRIRKQGFQRMGRTPEAATRKNRVPQLQFEGPGFWRAPCHASLLLYPRRGVCGGKV